MLMVLDEQLEEHVKYVREESAERMATEAAGILDALIDRLVIAKRKLNSSVLANAHQREQAAGIADCIAQGLVDDHPLSIPRLLAELDPADRITDGEAITSDIASAYAHQIHWALNEVD